MQNGLSLGTERRDLNGSRYCTCKQSRTYVKQCIKRLAEMTVLFKRSGNYPAKLLLNHFSRRCNVHSRCQRFPFISSHIVTFIFPFENIFILKLQSYTCRVYKVYHLLQQFTKLRSIIWRSKLPQKRDFKLIRNIFSSNNRSCNEVIKYFL